MTNTLTVLMALLMAAAVASPQDSAVPKRDEATEKALIANERALQEAVAKADKAAFESLVALSDGVWTTKQGFVLMRQLADSLHGFKFTKWEIANPRVTWLTEGSAVVSYTWIGAGTLFDQPLPPMALAITVWTRRDGKWVAVTHQQSDLTEPGARR